MSGLTSAGIASTPILARVGAMNPPTPNSLLKDAWFAAWGHAAYKISSEIGINCRPGALTGLLFQRAPNVSQGGTAKARTITASPRQAGEWPGFNQRKAGRSARTRHRLLERPSG